MNSSASAKCVTIVHTLDIVANCWMLAEREVQIEIKKYYPDADEEFITRMFHGRFAARVALASAHHHIEQAFLRDLSVSFPEIQDSSTLSAIAAGLVADVTLHKRRTERVTGGDFGLMIIRPQVIDHRAFLRIQDYRRGLLCQAKLRDHDGRWGQFTENQQEVLPGRLDYLGLLLYSYSDNLRRLFRPFQWQLCRQASSLEQVEQWMRTRTFPQLHDSHTIIQALGQGSIGTDDDTILNEIISPAGNPTFIITITWPDGRSAPGSDVRVQSSYELQQFAQARLQVRAN